MQAFWPTAVASVCPMCGCFGVRLVELAGRNSVECFRCGSRALVAQAWAKPVEAAPCAHARESWYGDHEYGTTFCGICHAQIPSSTIDPLNVPKRSVELDPEHCSHPEHKRYGYRSHTFCGLCNAEIPA